MQIVNFNVDLCIWMGSTKAIESIERSSWCYKMFLEDAFEDLHKKKKLKKFVLMWESAQKCENNFFGYF